MVGAIAFVLSPADIIPNMIPVLGELDDLFILTLALQHLVAHADEEVLRDHWPGDPEELTQLSVGAGDGSGVVLPAAQRARRDSPAAGEGG